MNKPAFDYQSGGPLNAYASNTYSQNGEDGVLAEIVKRLRLDAAEPNWCVEFGAWDGKHLSNTFALVERGWKAVYIEGDKDRYRELLKTAKEFPNVVPVNAYVARNSIDGTSLDNLLKKTGIPVDFDLLSIDIDSYDCDVWESLQDYVPKIVVIEINSSVPPGVIWRHSPKTPGNTFTATRNVGVHKGYTPVCHTGNLIFVRNDLLTLLELEERYLDFPELLFLYDSSWMSPELFQNERRRKPFIMRFVPKPLRPALKTLFRR